MMQIFCQYIAQILFIFVSEKGVGIALTFPPTPFLSRAAGEEGGGCALTSPLPPPLPRCGRGGGMSGAGAILRWHLSTMPSPPPRSPLSRSAGEGPGVRATRSAGEGPGVRATRSAGEGPGVRATRSAGEGPGVRAARSAGEGPGVRAARTFPPASSARTGGGWVLGRVGRFARLPLFSGSGANEVICRTRT